MAAGFSLPAENIERFHAFLDARLADAAALPDTVDVALDTALTVSGATVELAENLAMLAPFGAGNAEPLIAVSNAQIIRADRIGRDGNTLRLLLKGQDGGRLKALLFRANDNPLATALEDSTRPPVHLAGYLRSETWNGRTDATFFIQDAARA